MIQINRDILKLAIPSILANITVPLVGMVDIAVAGHLSSEAATMIGGIAIGSMLFDLLYWNFGFLRVGTGGLAAQAFGRGDRKDCARIFTRSIGIALACAMVLIAIQWIFVKAAFLVVDCTPEVRELASQYSCSKASNFSRMFILPIPSFLPSRNNRPFYNIRHDS